MTIKNTIESYRKRRTQMLPLIFIGVAVLLLVVSIILFSASGGRGFKLFASKTPTPSTTPTPTDTLPPSETPTITPTPTETPTATPSGPYDYVVQEGDSLFKIAEDRQLGENGIVLIYMLNPYNPTNADRPGINPVTGNIFVGQTITLPPPGMDIPVPTPWPTDALPGTRVSYFVLPGDSLGIIANKMNSTVAAILNANRDLLTEGENSVIYPGWTLIVPVNLVTPVPTATPTGQATSTPTPTATP